MKHFVFSLILWNSARSFSRATSGSDARCFESDLDGIIYSPTPIGGERASFSTVHSDSFCPRNIVEQTREARDCPWALCHCSVLPSLIRGTSKEAVTGVIQSRRPRGKFMRNPSANQSLNMCPTTNDAKTMPSGATAAKGSDAARTPGEATSGTVNTGS